MGGALWWLLAAAVSGSWLMLLALVLSLAAWAAMPFPPYFGNSEG